MALLWGWFVMTLTCQTKLRSLYTCYRPFQGMATDNKSS